MSVTEIKKTSEIDDEKIEIRLSDIVQFLKDSRKTILYWSVAFFVLGVLYAFSQQNEYSATVKVMPELKSSTGGASGLSDLRSLAGLAGVNLGNMNGVSEAIRPDLYPDIIQSTPFSLHLLRQPVTTVDIRKPQTLESYLSNQSENNFFSKIGNLFGGSEDNTSSEAPKTQTILLTKRQESLSKLINARVNAEMDKKSGIITITSTMPDAVVTATVAQKTLDYLTTYVTDYRTSKARQQVHFLKNQVADARQRYESSEFQLSSYRDRNRNTYLNTAKIEEQRLQADYLLAQGVYSDLAKQLELARLKVQEEAPVFQVLEPPRVPLKKSGPKRTVIVIGFTISGLLIGLLAFFIQRLIHPKSN